MDRTGPRDSAGRLAVYLDGLADVIGHAAKYGLRAPGHGDRGFRLMATTVSGG